MPARDLRKRPGAVRSPAKLATLGETIRRLYVEEKYSLREVARKVGRSVRMVERYLDGMGIPRRPVEEAKDLAKALAATEPTCFVAGCQQQPMLGTGACYFHLKRAMGLIRE